MGEKQKQAKALAGCKTIELMTLQDRESIIKAELTFFDVVIALSQNT